jgi:hypothetical protein
VINPARARQNVLLGCQAGLPAGTAGEDVGEDESVWLIL